MPDLSEEISSVSKKNPELAQVLSDLQEYKFTDTSERVLSKFLTPEQISNIKAPLRLKRTMLLAGKPLPGETVVGDFTRHLQATAQQFTESWENKTKDSDTLNFLHNVRRGIFGVGTAAAITPIVAATAPERIAKTVELATAPGVSGVGAVRKIREAITETGEQFFVEPFKDVSETPVEAALTVLGTVSLVRPIKAVREFKAGRAVALKAIEAEKFQNLALRELAKAKQAQTEAALAREQTAMQQQKLEQNVQVSTQEMLNQSVAKQIEVIAAEGIVATASRDATGNPIVNKEPSTLSLSARILQDKLAVTRKALAEATDLATKRVLSVEVDKLSRELQDKTFKPGEAERIHVVFDKGTFAESPFESVVREVQEQLQLKKELRQAETQRLKQLRDEPLKPIEKDVIRAEKNRALLDEQKQDLVNKAQSLKELQKEIAARKAKPISDNERANLDLADSIIDESLGKKPKSPIVKGKAAVRPSLKEQTEAIVSEKKAIQETIAEAKQEIVDTELQVQQVNTDLATVSKEPSLFNRGLRKIQLKQQKVKLLAKISNLKKSIKENTKALATGKIKSLFDRVRTETISFDLLVEQIQKSASTVGKIKLLKSSYEFGLENRIGRLTKEANRLESQKNPSPLTMEKIKQLREDVSNTKSALLKARTRRAEGKVIGMEIERTIERARMSGRISESEYKLLTKVSEAQQQAFDALNAVDPATVKQIALDKYVKSLRDKAVKNTTFKKLLLKLDPSLAKRIGIQELQALDRVDSFVNDVLKGLDDTEVGAALKEGVEYLDENVKKGAAIDVENLVARKQDPIGANVADEALSIGNDNIPSPPTISLNGTKGPQTTSPFMRTWYNSTRQVTQILDRFIRRTPTMLQKRLGNNSIMRLVNRFEHLKNALLTNVDSELKNLVGGVKLTENDKLAITYGTQKQSIYERWNEKLGNFETLNVPKADNPDAVQNIISWWRKTDDAIFRRAQKTGMDVFYLENHFHHKFNRALLKDPNFRAKSIKRIQDKVLAETGKVISDVSADRIFNNMIQEKTRTSALEMRRMGVPGYIDNAPIEVMKDYLYRTSRRVLEAEMFGPNDEILNDILDKVQKASSEAYTRKFPNRPTVHEEAVKEGLYWRGKANTVIQSVLRRQSIDELFGDPNGYLSTTRSLTSAVLFTAGTGAMQSLQIVNLMLNAGFGKTLTQLIRDVAIKSSRQEAVDILRAHKHLQEVIGHNLMGSVIDSTNRAAGFSVKSLSEFAAYKLTGINHMDIYIRGLSTQLGKAKAIELFEAFKKGNKFSRAAGEELLDSGIDPTGLTKDALSTQDILMYADYFQKRVNLTHNPAFGPSAWHNAHAQVLLQYKGILTELSSNIAESMKVKLKTEGTMPTMGATLTLLVGPQIAGEAIAALKNALLSKEEKVRSMAEHIIDNYAMFGTLGILSVFKDVDEYGFVDALLPPVIGAARRIEKEIKTLPANLLRIFAIPGATRPFVETPK